jgi:hypothetical protein
MPTIGDRVLDLATRLELPWQEYESTSHEMHVYIGKKKGLLVFGRS